MQCIVANKSFSPNQSVPGTTAFPSVSIEVFIKQDQVLPMGVVGIARVVTMAGPLAVLPSYKDAGNTMTDLLTDLEQSHQLPRSSRALHFEFIPIVEMIAL